MRVYPAHKGWLQGLDKCMVNVLVRPLGRFAYGPPLLRARVPPPFHLRLLLHKSVLENSRLRHRSGALGARACPTDYLAKPPINTTRPTGSCPLVWFSVSKSCPSPPECFVHNAKCRLQKFFQKSVRLDLAIFKKFRPFWEVKRTKQTGPKQTAWALLLTMPNCHCHRDFLIIPI